MPRTTQLIMIISEEHIEEDAIVEEVNKDFPAMQIDDGTMEELMLLLSSRISDAKHEQKYKGKKDVLDGEIHEIVNSYLFGLLPSDLLSGFSVKSSDGANVQIQVKSAYSPPKSSLKVKDKKYTETNDKILRLAEIFSLREAKRDDDGKVTEVTRDDITQGKYNFPEDTFSYRSSIIVDPSLVHSSQMNEFISDVVALGNKYTQRNDDGKPVMPSPVKEEQKLVAVPTFHKNRLKLGRVINEKIAQIFQNLSITIPKPKKRK